MQKRWAEQDVTNLRAVEDLKHQLNIDEVLATLLVNRGINTFDEARDFFRPSLNHLHDPFLMRDMEIAIARIEQAIDSKERILIYGDYDVDGTTSVSLVYSFFKKFHKEIDYYIPDRYKEGYGISTQGIDYAFKNNFGLSLLIKLSMPTHLE